MIQLPFRNNIFALVILVGMFFDLSVLVSQSIIADAFPDRGTSFESVINNINTLSEAKDLSIEDMGSLFGGWAPYQYCKEAFWGDPGCTSDYGCHYDQSLNKWWTRRAIQYRACDYSPSKDCLRINSQVCAFKFWYTNQWCLVGYVGQTPVNTAGCAQRDHSHN